MYMSTPTDLNVDMLDGQKMSTPTYLFIVMKVVKIDLES